MEPSLLGRKYDKIAKWWHDLHDDSDYGVAQLKKALKFCSKKGSALDVGCGSGGRIIRILQKNGFEITGIDVSKEMIKLAKLNHPHGMFYIQDISTWDRKRKFDFIIAWDSIFHLPLTLQESVLTKLCNLLSDRGVLLYTLGDADGEHDDEWRGDMFHYSSIGINNNLKVLAENGLSCKHLELDQWPEKHVYIIAVKTEPFHGIDAG